MFIHHRCLVVSSSASACRHRSSSETSTRGHILAAVKWYTYYSYSLSVFLQGTLRVCAAICITCWCSCWWAKPCDQSLGKVNRRQRFGTDVWSQALPFCLSLSRSCTTTSSAYLMASSWRRHLSFTFNCSYSAFSQSILCYWILLSFHLVLFLYF